MSTQAFLKENSGLFFPRQKPKQHRKGFMVPRAVLIVARTLSQVEHVVATEMNVDSAASLTVSIHFLVTSQNQNTDWLAARAVLIE